MKIIFGFMRFSFLGRSDVKLARANIDERRATLFASERLRERFYLFEQIALPSLRSQTDQDFRFAIFCSPELPQVWKDRMEMAIAGMPNVEVVYDDADHITTAVNGWIARQDIVHRERVVHFRLDDDDAVSSDFIATLRRNIIGVPDKCILTRPLGLLLANTPNGPALLARFEPYNAVGFAIVNDPGTINNPYQLRHNEAYRRYPSLMLPESLSYIYSAHIFSDTLRGQMKKLADAKMDHESLFGNKPRRFARAVEEAFAGRKVRQFLGIIANTPAAKAARDQAK